MLMFNVEVDDERIPIAYPEGVVPCGHVGYIDPLTVNIVKIGIYAADRYALIAVVRASVDLEELRKPLSDCFASGPGPNRKIY